MEIAPSSTCDHHGSKLDSPTFATPWKSGRVLSETQRARKREVNRITRRVQRNARRQDRIAQLELELAKLKEEQEEFSTDTLEDGCSNRFDHQGLTLPMHISSTSSPCFTPATALSLEPCLNGTDSCLLFSGVDGGISLPSASVTDRSSLDNLATTLDAAVSPPSLPFPMPHLNGFEMTESRDFGVRTGFAADTNSLLMDTNCNGSVSAQAVLYGWQLAHYARHDAATCVERVCVPVQLILDRVLS